MARKSLVYCEISVLSHKLLPPIENLMEAFSAFNNAKYQGKFISFDEEGASVNFRLLSLLD